MNNITSYDEDDADIDTLAGNIIDQIKNQSKSLKKKETEYPTLTEDNIDAFILEQASKLIIDASSIISDTKETVQTPTEVIAISELVKSVSSAIEILNKRSINDKKAKVQKEIKQMDIDSRINIAETESHERITLSQNEILKALLSKPKEEIGSKNSDITIDV